MDFYAAGAALPCRAKANTPHHAVVPAGQGREQGHHQLVILISAMRQGPTPRRVRDLSRLFGVDRATIARWQAFWRDHVPRTPFWKVARGRLVPVVEIAALPQSLLGLFCRTDGPCDGWVRLLRFLSPLKIRGRPIIEILR